LNDNRVLFLTFVLGMLGGCGQAPPKSPATEAQAASACASRAQSLFPGMSDGGNEMIGQPHISAKTDGHFVFEQDGLGNPDPSKPLLVCEGNLRKRVIESITFYHDSRRAPAGQTWSF
jgi:hypothetical protein